jgi:sirohydrochlorin ferrochelatase
VTYTGPLWESELLKQMFVQRVNANLDGVDKAHVGVLLVGHGQPHQWDVEWPTETEQEIRFRVEVLDRLAQAGYARNNLAMAWMEFREPHPAAKVEEFVANGVQQIFYFSAAISAEAIHSQVDVPELIDKARVPEGYPLVNLGAWNDDPLVIQAIKERIDDVMA